MDNKANNYLAEQRRVRAWQSGAAKFAIIYGLIALYAAIVLPFIPFNNEGVPFVADGVAIISNVYSTSFIFAILTSFSCVILGILVVVRLRQFGNGAIFTLHRVYFYFMVVYYALLMLVKLIGDNPLYTVLYFYARFIGISFAIGFVFIQITQIATDELHVTKEKAFYMISCLLVGAIVLGLNYLSGSLMGLEDESVTDLIADDTTEFIYGLTYRLAAVFFVINWYETALPVNEMIAPFGGKFFRKRTANNKVIIWYNWGFCALFVFETIYFIIKECYIMMYNAIIGLLLATGLFVWSILFNRNYDKKLAEKLKAEAEERLRIEKQKAEEEQKLKALKEPEKLKPTEEPRKEREVDYDYNDSDPKYLVKASVLTTQNRNSEDPYEFKIDGFTKELVVKMQSCGVKLSVTDAASLVAAFAASRVVFVSGVESVISHAFIKALATAFNTDVFVEKYYDNFIYQPEYEEVIEYRMPEITENASKEVAEDTQINSFEQTENNAEQVGAEESSTEQADMEKPIPEQPQPVAVTVKKEKPFVRNEKVIRTNKQHGVISSIFTANCLGHFIQTVFFDGTKQDLSKEQLAFMRKICSGSSSLKAGLHDYLPRTEFYDAESIDIPDNLWAVCFINEANYRRIIKDRVFSYGAFASISPLIAEDTAEDDGKFLSYEGIVSNIEETEDGSYLSESSWKKIDKIFAEIKLPERFAMDNRFIRQSEIYTSVQMAADRTEEEALDSLIAYKLLPYFASCGDAVANVDWLEVIDRVIGMENAPLTKKAILDMGLGNARRKSDDK